MPLSTLIQLHILLAMTPALGGWMLATPSHPMLARAMGVTIVQIRHVDPERMGGSRQAKAPKRSVSASIQHYCRRYLQRLSSHSVTARPAAAALRPFVTAPPALARAP